MSVNGKNLGSADDAQQGRNRTLPLTGHMKVSPGVAPASAEAGSRLPLTSDKLQMSPGVRGVPQEGAPGSITHKLRDGVQKITNVLEGPQMSDATTEKLAVLNGDPIRLGTKFALRFDIEEFLGKVVELGEENALRFSRINMKIIGPNGLESTVGLPLEKAMVWHRILTAKMRNISAASVDQKLSNALSVTRSEQLATPGGGDVNPNMRNVAVTAFEELRTFLPELPLAA
jgi:hypothetical protein